MPINSTFGAGSKRGFSGGGGGAAPFTTFTFTSAGVNGRFGPTLAQCIAAYSATAPWVIDTAFFNVGPQGYQIWTVPSSGTYTIQANGARGGDVNANVGASGARMTGTFSLTAGQKLWILVGQRGVSDDGGNGGGGGGGSFVTFQNASSEGQILIIAGGGGGHCNTSSKNPRPGSSGTSGTNADPFGTYSGGETAPGSGGGSTGGYGGINGFGGGGGLGAGGGGFFNRGGYGAFNATEGKGFVSGTGDAVGGTGENQNSGSNRQSFFSGVFNGSGGFGGGGGASQSNGYAGGGGGYSGGGGGTYDGSMGAGGGGGSYNAGSNQSNNTGGNSTINGFVVVTKL